METKIIEIREQLSNNQTRPGQFTLNLKQHLTLNDGDELNIRNIYIDSKKESNTILINEDIILTMVICRGWTFNSDYIVHYGNTDTLDDINVDKHIYLIKKQTTGTLEDSGYLIAADTPYKNVRTVTSLNGINTTGAGDTFTYYPTIKYPAVGGGYRYLDDITYGMNSISIANFGGFQAEFEYEGVTGKKEIFAVTFPKVSSSKVDSNLTITNGVIYNESVGFTLVHPSEADLKNLYNTDNKFAFAGSTVDNHDILHPITQTINISLKAGNYQPSILAEKINLQINNLNYQLDSKYDVALNIYEGSIFKDQKDSIYESVTEGNNIITGFLAQSSNFPANGISDYYHMVSEDNSNSLLKVGYTAQGVQTYYTNALMSGASTFQLIFDNITQTFKITNMHTPYYNTVGTGANASSTIGVSLQDFDVNGERVMTMNTKRADFKIISLTTDEKLGNFWYDKLGLDPNIITPITSVKRDYGGVTNELYVPNFNFNVSADLGTRRTDALVTNQIKLENKLFNPDYLSYPGDGLTPSPLLLPTTDIINIYGKKTLNDVIVDDAYFKIIINGLSDKLYDEEGTKLISAIVGKYYSGQSYTNGFSSDGINYVHRGMPITLSNFNINILSSKNDIPNIGTDNTIIIQVNKQITQESKK